MLKNIFTLCLITIFSIQIFPFEWIMIFLGKKTNIETIAKLTSQDDTDEDESSKKSIEEDQPSIIIDQFKLTTFRSFIKRNKHLPVKTISSIPSIQLEILSPPPDPIS